MKKNDSTILEQIEVADREFSKGLGDLMQAVIDKKVTLPNDYLVTLMKSKQKIEKILKEN